MKKFYIISVLCLIFNFGLTSKVKLCAEEIDLKKLDQNTDFKESDKSKESQEIKLSDIETDDDTDEEDDDTDEESDDTDEEGDDTDEKGDIEKKEEAINSKDFILSKKDDKTQGHEIVLEHKNENEVNIQLEKTNTSEVKSEEKKNINKIPILKKKRKKINSLSSVINLIKYNVPTYEELEDCKKVIDKNFEKYPKSKTVSYYKALVYNKLSKLELAIDNDGDKYLKQALDAFKKTQNLSKNDKEYNNFCESNINEIHQRYLERQYKYLRKGDNERVKDIFKICNDIYPNSPDTYLYMAMSEYEIGEYKNSLENYRIYQQLGGREAASYYGIALILNKIENNPDLALLTLEEGISIYPFNDRLISFKIDIINDKDELESFSKEIKYKFFSKKGAKSYQLAHFYKTIGEHKKAFSNFNKAAKYAKTSFEAQLSMGIEYFNKASSLMVKLKNKVIEEQEESMVDINNEGHKKKKKKKKKRKREKQKVSLDKRISKLMRDAKSKFKKANFLKKEKNPDNKLVTQTLIKINKYLNKKKKKKDKKIKQSI